MLAITSRQWIQILFVTSITVGITSSCASSFRIFLLATIRAMMTLLTTPNSSVVVLENHIPCPQVLYLQPSLTSHYHIHHLFARVDILSNIIPIIISLLSLLYSYPIYYLINFIINCILIIISLLSLTQLNWLHCSNVANIFIASRRSALRIRNSEVNLFYNTNYSI